MSEGSDNPCMDCGGMCCSFRSMQIGYSQLEPGERYDSYLLESDILDTLVFEDGEVPDMEWYVVEYPNGDRELAFHCNHREDGLCSEYERRPEMCSAFECGVLRGEETLDEYKEEKERGPGALEDAEVREVTERVREIIARGVEGAVA